MNCGVIDTETSQYSTDWCYARIFSDLEEKTITFVLPRRPLQLLVRILDHRAELHHGKCLPSIPMRSEE